MAIKAEKLEPGQGTFDFDAPTEADDDRPSDADPTTVEFEFSPEFATALADVSDHDITTTIATGKGGETIPGPSRARVINALYSGWAVERGGTRTAVSISEHLDRLKRDAEIGGRDPVSSVYSDLIRPHQYLGRLVEEEGRRQIALGHHRAELENQPYFDAERAEDFVIALQQKDTPLARAHDVLMTTIQKSGANEATKKHLYGRIGHELAQINSDQLDLKFVTEIFTAMDIINDARMSVFSGRLAELDPVMVSMRAELRARELTAMNRPPHR